MVLRFAACIALACLAASCAAAAPAVTRTVGGERREQTFVSPYAYEWYVRGELAASAGDLPAAAAAFRRARAGPNDDPYLIAQEAEVLDRMGEGPRAGTLLDEGAAHFPRSEAIFLTRGRIAERHGQPDRAAAAYRRAERVAPRSERGPLALAGLLRRRDRAGAAAEVLRRYLARAHDGHPAALRARLELALLRGDAEAAVESARRLLRVAPARADRILRTAKLALARGDSVVAADLLDVLPPGEAPLSLRVQALVAAGRRGRAEALLARSTPQAAGGLPGQARLYLAIGEPDRAEEIAELALELQGGPAAQVAAGQAELAQGKWVEAAEHFSRVPAGASVAARARAGLAVALQAQAFSGLADEVAGPQP